MTRRSELVTTLENRGFIRQATDLDGLDAAAATETITAYVGYDLTASSLHAGSLLSIMAMRRLQRCGHRPIILLGGVTTKVGDPSDKDKQRPLLDEATIAANKAGIARAFERYLVFGDGPTDARFVDNSEWLEPLSYVQFLRDYGVHFTINRMLTFDSVKRRLDREQPLTFLEFNYMLMQACDFHELHRRYACRLQVGGSYQWVNIFNGVELCRRLDEAEVFGLTTPLITTADGAKMGKTAGGAVWLDGERTPPYDFWQFWRNTADADVARFLRFFTDLPLDEIARLERLQGAEINDAKIALADAATALLHGAEAAAQAKATAEATFAGGGLGADLPTVALDEARLAEGVSVAALAVETGLCASGGEAKRHIKAGALKLGDRVVQDPAFRIDAASFGDQSELRLSVGKKKHARIARAV